jgi:hypothetical protein
MPTCLVITPIGPGHEILVREAQASVEGAFRANPGPFSHVLFMGLPDRDGAQGRSRRRNEGIDFALANGFEWIFFLDADDLMAGDAFTAAAPHLDGTDAVFGLIAEQKNGAQPMLRPRQLGPTTALADVLASDPFLSLQMGHFVRTKAAAAIRFDESMDTGEDFKYYLELWQQFRCAKINRVFFLNRRGLHSTGPRSAHGGNWRQAVAQVFAEFCARHAVTLSSPWWQAAAR